ncbi:peptidase C11 clostripain [Desulfatibacillum aliphaticivorans]|uniref:Peptidase C11 clostripain n=1 Tax=Desulfatibacillum aliphaticivorans TaxID=218208 RepID=B8FFD5_DESAL|nr:peptidase C11 clostripain [Desulfatibacillum aliphaticivorans]
MNRLLLPAVCSAIRSPLFLIAILTICLALPLSSWAAAPCQFSVSHFKDKQSNLGMPVLLEAKLVDASGDPIYNAAIYFDIYYDGAWRIINEDDGGYPTDYLGVAKTFYYVDSAFPEGDYPIRARFDGDASFDPASIQKTLTANLAGVTFALFLNGDNNIEADAIEDFYDELYPQGTNEYINFIVLFDRISGYDWTHDNWFGTRMYVVTPDTVKSDVYLYQDWGEQNMGDQSTLQAFAETAFTDFPAEHSVLVLWDHGSGWQGEYKSLPAEERDAPFTGAEVELPLPHQVAARLASKKSTAPPAGEDEDTFPVKAISYDNTSGSDSLSLTEVSGAIENAGLVVDVVAMDACLMGMVEVAYELRNVARYFVASGDSVSAKGFDYADIGQRLTADNAPGARSIASALVDSFENYYGSFDYMATLSAWDLTLMDPFFNALENFSSILLEKMDQIPYAERVDFYLATENMIQGPLYLDLGSLAYHAQQEISDAQVISAAADLESQVLGAACVNYFVHDGYYGSYKYTDKTSMRGLTIYLPPPDYWDHSYTYPQVLSFTDLSWNQTVRLLLDSTPPAAENSLEWTKAPYAVNESSIAMESFSAVDQWENPVYYQFSFTQSPTGGTGGNDSDGRYESTAYTDDDLEPNHQYCYTVYAYDGAGNPTETIAEACAVTLALSPGAGALQPKGCDKIEAAWDTGGNPEGTEYFCENITTGEASGWAADAQWTSSGLATKNAYTFRVKARNSEYVETDWVSLGDCETGVCHGDANADGALSLADAIVCLQVVAGLEPVGLDKSAAIDALQQIGLDEALYILQIEGESR